MDSSQRSPYFIAITNKTIASNTMSTIAQIGNSKILPPSIQETSSPQGRHNATMIANRFKGISVNPAKKQRRSSGKPGSKNAMMKNIFSLRRMTFHIFIHVSAADKPLNKGLSQNACQLKYQNSTKYHCRICQQECRNRTEQRCACQGSHIAWNGCNNHGCQLHDKINDIRMCAEMFDISTHQNKWNGPLQKNLSDTGKIAIPTTNATNINNKIHCNPFRERFSFTVFLRLPFLFK